MGLTVQATTKAPLTTVRVGRSAYTIIEHRATMSNGTVVSDLLLQGPRGGKYLLVPAHRHREDLEDFPGVFVALPLKGGGEMRRGKEPVWFHVYGDLAEAHLGATPTILPASRRES